MTMRIEWQAQEFLMNWIESQIGAMLMHQGAGFNIFQMCESWEKKPRCEK